VDESGPDIPAPVLGFGDQQSIVAPTFANQVGDPQTGQLPVGTGPEEGQVNPEALLAAGGPRPLFEGERTSSVVGTALDFTDALLGRTTGTQSAEQAEDPEFGLDALNPYQRVLLGIGDIVAVSQGRVMPSATLRAQGARGLTLEDQNNRQAMTTGFDLMKKTTDLLQSSNLSPSDRMALAATQVRTWESMLPGSGPIGLSIVSTPTEADALHAYMSNPEALTGTMAEQYMNYITAIGFVDPKRAGLLIVKGIEEGIFTKTIDNVGPSIIEAALPAQIEAARKMGGAMAAFANDIAAGREITPEKYIDWHSKLPEDAKTKRAYLESLAKDPGRYLTVFPGMTNAELVKKELEADITAERSAPVAMVNTNDLTDIVGGPSKGKLIRNLGPEYVPVGPYAKALFGDAGGGADVFGAPTIAMTTNLQKEYKNLRMANDELGSIRESFGKDLLTYKAKLKDLGLSVVESFGVELSPENTAFRERFVTLQTKALDALNKTLNRLSGAAVSPAEMERIAATMPNPSMDPGRFQIVMQARIDEMNFYIARFNVWRMTGNNQMGEQFNLTRSDVRAHVKNTAAKMLTDLAANNPGMDTTSPELKAEVAGVLSKELGLNREDLYRLFPQRGG
jgi:hypothetical protein